MPETPCSIGGLPALWGAPQSVRDTLQCWGLPVVLGGSLQHGGPGQTARAGGPGGHLPCCPLTWRPSALSAVNLDHFQILRAIGKGSFGKVRPRAGRTGHVWAGPAAWVCWRVWVCLPQGRPAMLEASGGAVHEPATTRLSWPRSLGSCSLAHPQPSWGCRWCAPGLFRGRDPEVHSPFTRAPFYRSRQSGPRPGREVLEKPLRGGLAPCVWSGSDTGAQRPGLR